MSYCKTQQKEIETITGRQFTLELSDEDVLRVCKKAGAAGLTVTELLQNFIGDLVCGTYSNGSDERDYAEQWFRRCGFEATAGKTFLNYLFYLDEVEQALLFWNSIKDSKAELEALRANLEQKAVELQSLRATHMASGLVRMNIELVTKDMDFITLDIEAVSEDLSCDTDSLTELYEDYKGMNGTDCSLEAAMENVLRWQKEMELLKGGVTPMVASAIGCNSGCASSEQKKESEYAN